MTTFMLDKIQTIPISIRICKNQTTIISGTKMFQRCVIKRAISKIIIPAPCVICAQKTVLTGINSMGNIVFLIRPALATTLTVPLLIASLNPKKGIKPQKIRKIYSLVVNPSYCTPNTKALLFGLTFVIDYPLQI